MADKPVRWMVAQDTFTTELKSGAAASVHRGDTFPDDHEVVLKDDGRGMLFKPLEDAPPEAPPARVSRAAAKSAGKGGT